MTDGQASPYRLARTIRVYAEFWVRALSSIAKLHWHRHHPTKQA